MTKRPNNADSIYQLKITLQDIRPPIWRRVLVPGNMSLGTLHEIIQTAMGWTNSHLHQFTISNKHYSDPDPDWEMEHARDQWKTRLGNVAPATKGSFIYEYDFGDGWEHKILVEKITDADDRFPGHPICLAGARACPPEDCGGPWGYADFLAAIRDPEHEEHESLLDWIGGSFNPELFDLVEVNELLRQFR